MVRGTLRETSSVRHTKPSGYKELSMSIGILFGSTTGNTEDAARQIHQAFGDTADQPRDIAEVTAKEIAAYAHLILGASTWGAGDLQDDWQASLGKFDGIDLNKKKVAIFGLGDQFGYSDTFVDGMCDIAEKVRSRGAEIVGKVSTGGYEFAGSRAVEGGEFLGLPLDVENQNDKTNERVAEWVEALKAEML